MRRFITGYLALLPILLTSLGLCALPVAGSVAAAMPVYVAADASQGDACQGIDQLDNSSQQCGQGQSALSGIVKAAVNILSFIAGIAAVIMIIIAGFKYITSGGDAGGINSAKTTLIYAMVGLAIAALAQFLVHFVIGKVVSGTSG